MPKNDADPKYDREDNRADKKNNQQNNANFTGRSANAIEQRGTLIMSQV